MPNMGWLFTSGTSRSALIEELTRTQHSTDRSRVWETVAHCARGNYLWAVVVVKDITPDGIVTELERRIEGFMLRNGGHQGWGYKSQSETGGFGYATCPVSYLDMVPCPDSDTARKWREEVRKLHKATHAPAGAYLLYTHGIRFTNGRTYRALQRIEGTRRRAYRGLYLDERTGEFKEDWQHYKLTPNALQSATVASRDEALAHLNTPPPPIAA
jgi:hypothetical protein